MFLYDFIIWKNSPIYISDVETWTFLRKLNGSNSEDGDSSVQ